jgi:hypothetical protein
MLRFSVLFRDMTATKIDAGADVVSLSAQRSDA